MIQQRHAREMGEHRAALSMRQLLCAVFIWRAAMTRILPLCGNASWWVCLVCLLPGILTAVGFRIAMALTGASTVMEAVRNVLGRVGAALFSWVLAALLLVEAASTLTALLTVFTQGVGTKGTQFTLALLTGVVLLFCLHREGLPRGIYLLRWVMIALLLLLAGYALGDAQVDNIFPLSGDDSLSLAAAWKAGMSLSWPVILILTVPCEQKRGFPCIGVVPIAIAVGMLLLTVLTIPQEMFQAQTGMADLLLLPIRYMPNALRVTGLCLLMLSFFMSVGASVQLATTCVLAPVRCSVGWLPYAVLGILVSSQALDIPQLWALLGMVEPWLLLPLAGILVISLPFAAIRRKQE